MAEVPFNTRQTQILGQVETTAGTAETLTATDGGVRVFTSPEVSPDFPLEDLPIARQYMSVWGKLTTTQAMGIAFRSPMNSPDTITAEALEHKPYLEGSGHTIEDLSGIGIGAISGGPYTRGETVEDESGNTGRVVRQTATGEPWLYYDPISGTLTNSEELTGSSSGATCDSSSATANHGYIGKPTSNNQKTITMRKEEDGHQWSIVGAMSNFNISAENSKPCYFDFAFVGPFSSQGAQAMTSGIDYQTEKPPKFQGAGLTIGSVASTSLVVKTVTFNQNSEPVKREDANTATTGIISVYKADRGDGPKLTISLEMPPASVYDVITKLTAESTDNIKFNVGDTKGKAFMFFADYAQVESVSYTDTDGIRTFDVTYVCVGSPTGGDDEYEMIWY